MERTKTVVTPERYASGMTFEQYLPVRREPREPPPRGLAQRRARAGTGAAGCGAGTSPLRLSGRPDGGRSAGWRPSRTGRGGSSSISEEWSSDCRRDIPMLKRLAEAGGLELRIFRRDGQRFGRSQPPEPGRGAGQQRRPHGRVPEREEGADLAVDARWPRSTPRTSGTSTTTSSTRGSTTRTGWSTATSARRGRARRPMRPMRGSGREFAALQASPFFRIWASAAVDEILSALHERVVLGPRVLGPRASIAADTAHRRLATRKAATAGARVGSR